MIENFRSVVNHGHDVRIVVFIVVIERIEEYSKADPLIRTTEHRSIVIARARYVPESLTNFSIITKQSSDHGCFSREQDYHSVRADSSTPGDSERQLHIPPIEIRGRFRPYST